MFQKVGLCCKKRSNWWHSIIQTPNSDMFNWLAFNTGARKVHCQKGLFQFHDISKKVCSFGNFHQQNGRKGTFTKINKIRVVLVRVGGAGWCGNYFMIKSSSSGKTFTQIRFIVLPVKKIDIFREKVTLSLSKSSLPQPQ